MMELGNTVLVTPEGRRRCKLSVVVHGKSDSCKETIDLGILCCPLRTDHCAKLTGMKTRLWGPVRCSQPANSIIH